MGETHDLTQLFERIEAGDDAARDALWERVFDEVRELAGREMRSETPGHTLQATALVGEVYLRLFRGEAVSWENRRHFFGTVARAMRRILVEHARRKRAQGHALEGVVNNLDGGGQVDPHTDFEALDRALAKLEAEPRHVRKVQIVQLRYFAGRTVEEISELLDVSTATVKRDWKFARAWLFHELDLGERA